MQKKSDQTLKKKLNLTIAKQMDIQKQMSVIINISLKFSINHGSENKAAPTAH